MARRTITVESTQYRHNRAIWKCKSCRCTEHPASEDLKIFSNKQTHYDGLMTSRRVCTTSCAECVFIRASSHAYCNKMTLLCLRCHFDILCKRFRSSITLQTLSSQPTKRRTRGEDLRDNVPRSKHFPYEKSVNAVLGNNRCLLRNVQNTLLHSMGRMLHLWMLKKLMVHEVIARLSKLYITMWSPYAHFHCSLTVEYKHYTFFLQQMSCRNCLQVPSS